MGCLLGSGVLSAAEQTIPVQVSRSQLNEGLNLLSTSPSGYSLYGEVNQGQVTGYIVKDSSGNEVPSTTTKERGKIKICIGIGEDKLCWEAEWES